MGRNRKRKAYSDRKAKRFCHDSDGDSVSDPGQFDSDGDSVSDPGQFDSDGDSVSDPGQFDSDGDSVSDPGQFDSDGDSVFDPGQFDSDGDSVSDPGKFDSDGDSVTDSDGDSVTDSDGDSVTDSDGDSVTEEGDEVSDSDPEGLDYLDDDILKNGDLERENMAKPVKTVTVWNKKGNEVSDSDPDDLKGDEVSDSDPEDLKGYEVSDSDPEDLKGYEVSHSDAEDLDTPLEDGYEVSDSDPEGLDYLDDDILKNEGNLLDQDLELPIPEGSFNLFYHDLNVNLESGFNTDLEKENMAKPVKTVTVWNKKTSTFKKFKVSNNDRDKFSLLIELSELNRVKSSLEDVITSAPIVVGCISFGVNGVMVDGRKSMYGYVIPQIVGNIDCDAAFILLVEDSATYNELAERHFYERFQCVIIRTKGPDFACKQFLKKLKTQLNVPVLALVDPCCLKLLSAFEIDIKWLGVFPSDACLSPYYRVFIKPLTEQDIKIGKDLLIDHFVKMNPKWVEELNLMLRMNEKVEVQALSADRIFFDDIYFPMKLRKMVSNLVFLYRY